MLLHESPQHFGQEVGVSLGLPVELLGQRVGVALVAEQMQQQCDIVRGQGGQGDLGEDALSQQLFAQRGQGMVRSTRVERYAPATSNL